MNFKHVEPYLSKMLAQLFERAHQEPENTEVTGMRDTLIALDKLRQREMQSAKAQNTGRLIELARVIETDYLEFRIKGVDKQGVHIEVYDAVLHENVAVLIFKEYRGSFLLDGCNFSSYS